MRCFARLIRCAIVASGTRNALAISAGREPAHRPQRERELRRDRQRGMAAEEQERERVVTVGPLVGSSDLHRGVRLLPAPSRALAPPSVDEAPGGDRDEPRPRIVGHTAVGPLQPRGEQRLLYGVLARVELAVPAHQCPEDLRRELPQQVLDPWEPVVRTPVVRP